MLGERSDLGSTRLTGGLVAIALATLAIGLALGTPAAAQGDQTTYVVDDGRSSPECTASNPCGSISTALAKVGPGDTVVVRPGTYDESFSVQTEAVTVCGTSEAGTACESTPEDVKVTGGSGAAYVATLSKPDVRLQGLTILAEEPASGVNVRSADAEIIDNRIVSNRATGETEVRTIGINVVGSDVVVKGNEISGWIANAVGVWKPGATIEDNTFRENRVGVHLAGVADGVSIEDNDFRRHLWAVRLAGNAGAGEPKQQPGGLVLRENSFPLSNGAAIRLESNNVDNVIDARLNDWGVYDWRALEGRVDDRGEDNRIRQIPFVDRDGQPEPGKVGIQGESATYLSVQEAVRAADPGDTVLVPASSRSADPTPRFESLDVRTPGVRICSTSPGTPSSSDTCQGHAEQTLIDGARDGTRTAIVREEGVTLQELTLRWRGDADSSVTGLAIGGNSPGVQVVGSRILVGGETPGQFTGVVNAGASQGVELRDSLVATVGTTSKETGYPLANGVTGHWPDGVIENNTIRGWTVHGIFLSTGDDVTIVNNTFESNLRGLLLCRADRALLEGNEFRANTQAVRICGFPEDLPRKLRLRDNELGPGNAQALVLEAGVEDLTIDARLNDWGVYEEETIPARIDDRGTGNQVLTVPFQLPDGSPEPGLVRLQRTGERFLGIQAAVDEAAPGDTVLVGASRDLADPTPRRETVDVTTEDLTICSTVAGGTGCAANLEAGHWQLSRSEWADAPGTGSGEAIKMDAPRTETTPCCSTSFFPPSGLQIDEIDALSYDLYVAEGECGFHGSPRIKFQVDTDGDGEDDAFLYARSSYGLSGGCPKDTWFHDNVLADPNTEWTGTGPFANVGSQAEAAQAAGPAHQIVGVNWEWSHTANAPNNPALVYLDNQRINGWLLGERQDVVCSGFGVHDGEQACRQSTARARTVVDGSGASTVFDLRSEDSTLQGLTVRWTGAVDHSVELVSLESAHRSRVADNVLQARPSECEPATIAGQVGCFADVEAVDARESKSVAVLDNRVTANVTHLAQSLTGGHNGIAVTKDANVSGNLVDGFKNAVKLDGIPGGFSGSNVQVRENRLAGSLIGLHVRCDATDASVVENGLVDNVVGTLACVPPAQFHRNQFGPSHLEVFRITPVHDDKTYDLRRNDWGVYSCEAIEQKINDRESQDEALQGPREDGRDGGNTIKIAPYLGPTGHAVPPKLDPTCPAAK